MGWFLILKKWLDFQAMATDPGNMISHLGGIDGSAITSGKSTAKEADFVQRSRIRNFNNGRVRHDCIFREGADPKEVVNLFPFAGEPAGFVWHQVLRFTKTVLKRPQFINTNKSMLWIANSQEKTKRNLQTNSLGFQATIGVRFQTRVTFSTLGQT